MSKVAAYGTWQSPITPDLIVSSTVGLGQILVEHEDIYWLESRPSEGGRSVIVKCTSAGQISDITPSPFNVRSRVHEYGGGAFLVADRKVYFSNFTDQRLYSQISGEIPKPITPETNLRYADGIIDRQRQQIICVREDHTINNQEPINTLCAVSLLENHSTKILISGQDFYSSPCLSPDGLKLAWLTWNHPNMPWDGTELWMAEFAADGTLINPQCVAGGVAESIFQPQWSPEGVLYFISDRTGWWNFYRYQEGIVQPLLEMSAEFATPQWVFGMSTYSFVSENQIICTYTVDGFWYLATLDTTTGKLQSIPTNYSDISYIQVCSGKVVFLAGSATESTAIVTLDLATQECTVLRRCTEVKIAPGYLSKPQAIAFPTTDGKTAYGFYYPPQNQDYTAPEGELPPLRVKSHGGPTAATSSSFSLSIQYWTSRGFGFLDVNYGGSTGYGREYRQRLNDQWGIVDVDDCTNGAKYLVEKGEVDGDRLIIAGGSAGGYTTLCALTFRDTFKAGASYYGVSDLEALAQDTHKFESRYLDGLIGAYLEKKAIYQARSPIHFTAQLSCPVIFFQGLEDKVVPPNQAEMMVAALQAKGLPVAYVPFEGEQHGFRRAENIKRALEAELSFYAQIFGFQLAME